MENGGQIFRITQDKKRDKFFYKLENGELMCRINEIGGWHKAIGAIRWESDTLEIAKNDYKYSYFPSEIIHTPLPTLKETTGCDQIQ